MAKKTNVPILGITRNTDDGVCKDGECLELINARIKNGSLEPIGKPIQEKVFADTKFSRLYFHSIANKYVGVIENNGRLYSMNAGYSGLTPLSDSVINVDRVEFIGYTMMAINDECIHYFIFSNGVYRYLGTKPELPLYKISATGKVVQESSTEKFTLLTDAKYFQAETGYQTKAISKVDFFGKALCRYALKMYDGSYIMHSPVFLLQAPQTAINGRTNEYMYTGSRSLRTECVSGGYMYCYALGFKPLIEKISGDLAAWKDIIVGVDFFITRPLPDYFIGKATHIDGTEYEKYYYQKDDRLSTIKKDIPYQIKSNNLFYKFAEAKIDSLGVLGVVNMIEDFGNLALKDVMPDDQFTRNTFLPMSSYVYNSRLHLGDIKESIFKGFSLKDISMGNNYSFDECVITTYLTSSGGVQSVLKKAESNVSLSQIYPFLMYPDSRAYKIIIELRKGTLHYQKTYTLQSSEFMNMSYWIDESLVNISDGAKDMMFEPDDVSNWVSDRTLAAGEMLDKTEVNTFNIAYNKLKVSELNNPFFFPAKTTYQPSNGRIIALCSNTVALSQGQFGQHPLLVFCDDGVYAMSVGTSGVVYATSTPVTRDVCNNPKSVKGIDSAVVFSTEQGVMMIQGSQVINLSTSIDGYLPSCVDSSQVIGKIMSIPNLQSALSVTTFADYAKGAEIGYNYQEREVIVANPSYEYVYVYNFNSGTWSKMSMQIDSFVNSYPDILALSHRTDVNAFSVVWNMQNNHRSVADIVFISRPVKLGTLTHKRILQSAMRGMIKKSSSDFYLRGESVQFRGEGTDIFSSAGFYVLGSNDAEHFSLISGREKIVDIRDLITKMNKTKAYKYFMFAVVGGVRTDVAINYIELIVDESFENRLR